VLSTGVAIGEEIAGEVGKTVGADVVVGEVGVGGADIDYCIRLNCSFYSVGEGNHTAIDIVEPVHDENGNTLPVSFPAAIAYAVYKIIF
jgi:hypothetical protein